MQSVVARSTRARSLRLALAQLALAGLGLGAVEIVLYTSPTLPHASLFALFTGVGVLYLAAGVLAWDRRPSNRTGAILCLGGLAVLAAAAGNTARPALVATGYVTGELAIGVLIWLLLAFPSGRLPDARSRALVASALLVTLVLQLPDYLFSSDPLLPGALRLAERPRLVDLGEQVQSTAGAIVVVLAALVLVLRLRRAERAQRRVLAPLYAYGVFTILFLVVSADVVKPLFDLDVLTLFKLQVLAVGGIPIAFVAGLLLGGFARMGELEELGVWLGTSEPDHPDLREALGETLGDPSLELLFWLPELEHYVNAEGVSATLPEAGSGRSAVDIALGDRRVGAIVYDETLIGDPEPARAAAGVAALALERERLTAELLAHREALRESRARLVEAGDRERRRIAQDLHDGLQGRLVLLALRAEAPGLRRELEEAIAELRRLVHGVMPALLIERGLYAATEELVDALPIRTRLELSGENGPLPPPVESTGYFVVAEALANAVKHSSAQELFVRLGRPSRALEIDIADDGVGGASFEKGAGLRGIADRIDVVGGRLFVESTPGRGTRIHAEIPCAS